MKHRPFENWILFDLPLTLQEQAEMDNHLAQCLACRALQSGVVRAEAGFRGARLAEPRSGFVARWRNRLDQETERRRHGTAWWTFAWTTLAAVPFALTLGWQALVLPGSLSTLLADLLLQLIRWWTWLRLVGEIGRTLVVNLSRPPIVWGLVWMDDFDRLGRKPGRRLVGPYDSILASRRPQMKAIKIVVLFGMLLALAIPYAAFAAGTSDGRVVIGGTYTLLSGDVLAGDLVVIGGAATLEAGSRVEGDVALIGGLLNASGEIEGDVFAMGGVVTLGPGAVIHGDLVTMGAVVSRDAAAVVEGQVTEGDWQGFGFNGPSLVLPPLITGFEVPPMRWGWDGFNPLFGIGWSILRSLLMAGLAVLIVMFWPERTARVARTITSQPVAAGGIGLLTAFFAVSLIVVLAISICLIPFSLVGALLLGAGFIFGWVAMGLLVGWRMAQAFKRDWHPATQAGLGTLVLSLVVYAVNLIPCVGFVFWVMLAVVGLGAVTLTRFGGQDSLGAPPSSQIVTT